MAISNKEILRIFDEALIREANAFIRYDMLANYYKKQGYNYIAQQFTVFAENEKEHYESLIRVLTNMKFDVTRYRDAFANINYLTFDIERSLRIQLLTEDEDVIFYDTALTHFNEDKYKEAYELFKNLRDAEERHGLIIFSFLERLENNEWLKSPDMKEFVCSKCGNIILAEELKEKDCPLCKEPITNYYYDFDLPM